MSWQAMRYAARLPLSRVNGGARAVLLLLAEHAHDDGRGAFPAVATLAETLGVSDRSVKRYLAELRESRLITPGDGALVAHMRADRRPQVWDIPGADPYGVTPADTPHGVTPSPDDVTAAVTPLAHGVTDPAPRGDRSGQDGVTAAVPQNRPRTTQEPCMHAGTVDVVPTTAAAVSARAPAAHHGTVSAVVDVITSHRLGRRLWEQQQTELAEDVVRAGATAQELAQALAAESFGSSVGVGAFITVMRHKILPTLRRQHAVATTPAEGRRCQRHSTTYSTFCGLCRADVRAGDLAPEDASGELPADTRLRAPSPA